jgi:hypothetical protein
MTGFSPWRRRRSNLKMDPRPKTKRWKVVHLATPGTRGSSGGPESRRRRITAANYIIKDQSESGFDDEWGMEYGSVAPIASNCVTTRFLRRSWCHFVIDLVAVQGFDACRFLFCVFVFTIVVEQTRRGECTGINITSRPERARIHRRDWNIREVEVGQE